MFDIIGDVHGHADKLIRLLENLGYVKKGGVWSHPSRTLVSVGDLIDRGPNQRKVIDILKPMAEAGSAIVLMGNHEFNAVSWYLTDSNGAHLRVHNHKNFEQHKEFLCQAEEGSEWYKSTIEWFMSLPFLLEHRDFICVHAAWSDQHVNILKDSLAPNGSLNPLMWEHANNDSHELYHAIEHCLKGPEVPLPEGQYFIDGGNHKRTAMRLRWWDVNSVSTYQNSAVSVPNPDSLPNVPLPEQYRKATLPNKPIFFGHYWMVGKPELLNDTIACLDWSVVKQNGYLVAYRFDGEQILDSSKLVYC